MSTSADSTAAAATAATAAAATTAATAATTTTTTTKTAIIPAVAAAAATAAATATPAVVVVVVVILGDGEAPRPVHKLGPSPENILPVTALDEDRVEPQRAPVHVCLHRVGCRVCRGPGHAERQGELVRAAIGGDIAEGAVEISCGYACLDLLRLKI